eukprot:2076734-Rhodomonas_salina.1
MARLRTLTPPLAQNATSSHIPYLRTTDPMPHRSLAYRRLLSGVLAGDREPNLRARDQSSTSS